MLAAACARTEVSSTSSPTVTRTPPISDGSTATDGLQLAAEFLFQRGDQVVQLLAFERERADDRASAAPSGHFSARGIARRFPATAAGDRFRPACATNSSPGVVLERRLHQRTEQYRLTCSRVTFGLVANASTFGQARNLCQLRDEVGPGREIAGFGHAEQRFCVRTGDGCEFGHDYSSVFSWFSRSACAAASTSRFRICSAPFTASAATSARSASRAFVDLLFRVGLRCGNDARSFVLWRFSWLLR